MKTALIGCAICGSAFCAHVAHEAHQNADEFSYLVSPKPAIPVPVYMLRPHGNEPVAPSWPIRTVEVAQASTAPSASGAEQAVLTWPS